MIRQLVLLVFACWTVPIISQTGFGQDQIELAFPDYIGMIQSFHPLAMQAELRLNIGDANIQEARGGFDPIISTTYDNKRFKDINYYRVLAAKMKIPTNTGIYVNSKFEMNDGNFLNPQLSNPDQGLYSIGVTVPLGQGLFFDKRRAVLEKAKLFRQGTDWERIKLLNELFVEASLAYFDWYQSHEILSIYENALSVAIQRKNAIVESALLGDSPIIDTVEAGIQVQNRIVSRNDALLDFRMATELLSTFLWNESGDPLEINAETLVPDSNQVVAEPVSADLTVMLDSLIVNHPSLTLTRIKGDMLGIERRLAREYLKPKVDVDLNYLTAPGSELINSSNNYSWGVDFSFPLFLRSERGKLGRVKNEIVNNQLELTNKRQQLQNSINQSIHQWDISYQQLATIENTVNDYQALLQGEQRLFELGESSLFLINSRELGLIEAQIKLVQAKIKNQKARIYTLYSSGILYQTL